MAVAVVHPPETGRLAVLTGQPIVGRTRYDNPALGKPLRTLLEHLEAAGWLDHRRGHREGGIGVASSIAPTSWLTRRVTEAGITLEDFGRLPGEEVIILSRKDRYGREAGGGVRRELVDYADTAETNALRGTVRTLNDYLEGASLAFVDDGLGVVDTSWRTSERHFGQAPGDASPDFTRGGRLFGGFWQNLKRPRRGSIRIEGEATATLDFSAMFPRLAYAAVGAYPPPGDLYAIPGVEGHRAGVKLAVNTLLFDDFRRSRWPVLAEGDPVLPSEWTVARVTAALLHLHPALKGCFGTGMGHQLMHTESVILVHVLEELRSRGIVALGLHDGLLVPLSRGSEAREVMVGMAQAITSQALPVTLAPTA